MPFTMDPLLPFILTQSAPFDHYEMCDSVEGRLIMTSHTFAPSQLCEYYLQQQFYV